MRRRALLLSALPCVRVLQEHALDAHDVVLGSVVMDLLAGGLQRVRSLTKQVDQLLNAGKEAPLVSRSGLLLLPPPAQQQQLLLRL